RAVGAERAGARLLGLERGQGRGARGGLVRGGTLDGDLPLGAARGLLLGRGRGGVLGLVRGRGRLGSPGREDRQREEGGRGRSHRPYDTSVGHERNGASTSSSVGRPISWISYPTRTLWMRRPRGGSIRCDGDEEVPALRDRERRRGSEGRALRSDSR